MQDEIRSMSEAEVLAELNTTKQRMEKLALKWAILVHRFPRKSWP